jgi:hypothetical protein
VGSLQNVIRTAVISALGAKMARGRSPIVAALLVSRALCPDGRMRANPPPADQRPRGGRAVLAT